MKIFRIIASDDPFVVTRFILAKNKKEAKKIALHYGFSRFLLDTTQPKNAISFWENLEPVEKDQFEQALVNNFFNEEVL